MITSPADVYPFTCGSQYSEWGASFYEKGDEYLLKELYGTYVLGNVVDTDDGSNLMVQINVDEGLYLGIMYLYVGPLSGLGSCPLKRHGHINYGKLILIRTPLQFPWPRFNHSRVYNKKGIDDSIPFLL